MTVQDAVRSAVRSAVLDALAVLMPVECVACAAPDRALCARCAEALRPERLHRQLIGRDGGDPIAVASALRYDDVVRRAILAFKRSERTDVARALAAPLSVAVLAVVADRELELVAVPSSRAAYRRRGYDPVRLLLGRAGLHHARVLAVSGARSEQKSLSIADRQRNVEGSMVATGRLDARRFVIVDDVVTTGATIAEGVRAIEAAGGTVVAAATLAFTARLLPSRDISHDQDYGGAKGAQ